MSAALLLPTDTPDVLLPFISGRKTALLTAASAVNHKAVPTWRTLSEVSRLKILFSPEHGLSSALREGDFGHEDGNCHAPTGASLYDISALSPDRLADLLRSVDIAVYDIQDVGARFYTYIANLSKLMRAAREARVPVLVLDRPNPLGCRLTEGPILDESRFSSFIGEYAVPIRYGLTAGEYARFINTERGIGCELHVLPVVVLTGDVYMDETDLLWVNPSPNIPSVGTALNYIGSCIYEATNLSEGRGTTHPFDYLGAPFVDTDRLCREMEDAGLSGVVFRPMEFVPLASKYAGEICRGVELHITDRALYRPVEVMLHMFHHFKTYSDFWMDRHGVALRFGQDTLADDYNPALVARCADAAARDFAASVAPYRLYP